jgi:PEP-CTERM/exosortase A-associated glycosyltransferase
VRILHVLDHSLPLQSGYAFRTIAILREQRALGWETLQLTTPRHGPTAEHAEEVDGWSFHRTTLRNGLISRVPGVAYLSEMAATTRRLARLVNEFRPDLIHAHSPVLNALPALRVGRREGIPIVYEVRALWEDGAVDQGKTREGSLRYRSQRALETFALRRVDHVFTICEGLRGEIAGRGIHADRITVIPNAVDTESFNLGAQPDDALRAQLELTGKTVLGFVGSFYGYEGLEVLVEALALLAGRAPQLSLLLVGGGPEEQALKALATNRGVSDRVVFAGRVPHADVGRYYNLIDLLVYPRRRVRVTELVTPLKPLEAMAQGRMLVASDVGGHRELIQDGQTGYLFPADDKHRLASKIETVLADRAAWPNIRARARHFVETERSWPASAARYAAVYVSLTRPSHALTG